MDDKRIAEIRAREQAATPGPWEARVTGYTKTGYAGGPSYFCVLVPDGPVYNVLSDMLDKDDAAFIAHARQDVPDLLAALAAERERAAKLEQALDRIANDHATQVEYAARDDWHGLFNWAQDVAKDTLSEKE